MKEVFEFSDGRIIRFRRAKELVFLNEKYITNEAMLYLDKFWRKCVDTIYVKGENNQIIGILTPGDVMKNIDLGTCTINKNFKCIRVKEQMKEEFVKDFFNTYTTIRNLPVIIDEQLEGEYELQIGKANLQEQIQWKTFQLAAREFFKEKDIRKIYIAQSEEFSKLNEMLSTMDNMEVVLNRDIKVDFSIIDTKTYKENLLKVIKSQALYNEQDFVGLSDFYINCMIRYISKALNEYNVKICLVGTPQFEKIKGFSAEKKASLQKIRNIEQVINSEPEILEEFFSAGKSKGYITGDEFRKIRYIKNGYYYCLADFQGEYINIVGGKRVTPNVPRKYKKTVWVFGNCTARGYCVCDSETIETYLQEICNAKYENSIRVVNCGVANALGCINDLNYMLNTQICENDIILFLSDYEEEVVAMFKECGITYLETSELFNEPNEYGRWYFDDVRHINHTGNRLIASFIYENLKGDIERNIPDNNQKFVLSLEKEELLIEERVLDSYIQSVLNECKKKNVKLNGKVGAIVMNCNPFTNGHKYLIEESIKNVDSLIIFVVEENKSVFPFDDRIELVKKGTSEWENVVVVPSGKFIISSETFPGYFIKEQLQEVEIDSSNDVNIFAQYIAPRLNIQLRFVGEEPFDNVTRVYNRTMAEILPKYGIGFSEIPRKKSDGQIISASYVRKLLSEGKYEEIKKYVPDTTFLYLKKGGQC